MADRPDLPKLIDLGLTGGAFVLVFIFGAVLRGQTVNPNAFPIWSSEGRFIYFVALLLSAYPLLCLLPLPQLDDYRPSWKQIYGSAVATLGSLTGVVHYHDWSAIIGLGLLATIASVIVWDDSQQRIQQVIGVFPTQALTIALSSFALLSMIYGFRARSAIAGPVTALILIIWMLALRSDRHAIRASLPVIVVGAVLMFELQWVLDHWSSGRWEGGAILALSLGALVTALTQHQRATRIDGSQPQNREASNDPLY